MPIYMENIFISLNTNVVPKKIFLFFPESVQMVTEYG